MLLLDLYSALRPLDEITGATTTDDILNLIFSRFCIGKQGPLVELRELAPDSGVIGERSRRETVVKIQLPHGARNAADVDLMGTPDWPAFHTGRSSTNPYEIKTVKVRFPLPRMAPCAEIAK